MPSPEEFHEAMINIHRDGLQLERRYDARYFIRMVHEHGGIEAARQLLGAKDAQKGLFSLQERNALFLSVEALVLKPDWAGLFSDEEKQVARQRLDALNSRPEDDPRWL